MKARLIRLQLLKLTRASPLLLCVFLAACQTTGPRDAPVAIETEQDDDTKESIENPDLIYALIAAELSRQEEDYESATDYYMEAALLSDDIEIARQAVRLALYTGQFEKASAVVARWREIAPEDMEATQYAVSIALKTREADKIEQELGRVVEGIGPNEVDAWRSSAKLLTNLGDPAQARDILRRLIGTYGQNASVAAMLAQSQLLRHFESNMDAMELANKAIKNSPLSVDARLWRAQLNFELGQNQATVLDLQAAYEMRPEDTALGFRLANMLQELGEYERARKVLKALPQDSGALFALGAFALQSEHTEDAEAAYLALVSYCRENNDGWFFAGQLAELLARPDEAYDWYKNVQAGDTFQRAGLRRARLAGKKSGFAAAKLIIDELRESESANQESLFLLEGELLIDGGSPEDALEVYSRGLVVLPDSSNLRYARALLAESLDDLDLAESDLLSVIENNPGDASALNALGYTLADRTDRLKEARGYIEKALAIEPETPAIIDSMGWVLFRMGEYEESIRFLKTALRLQQDGEIAAHLVEVLWAQGWKDEAKKVWESALEAEPESAVLLETIERLNK